ncbi:replication initiation protein [Austwickia chelonae]|uniref:replication initiation protein n=1 Tax=Austwickia chelonae TaxID=100225 RepID=UPI0013C33F3E|nr:replication initiation protein [Austwickia chelonae]
MNSASFADEFSTHWLPRAPLAGSVKDSTAPSGVRRHTREVALGLPYVEANPLAVRSLIVTDHDGADADLIAGLRGLPQPSYIALNPLTHSGHIVYALNAPVCLTDAGHRAPMNLLARVESGLFNALEGDLHYAGRLTKNPYHAAHLPLWGHAEALYGLRDLARALDDLDLLPRYEPRKTLTTSLIGRNCALFDLTRRWAYRAWRRYAHDAREWDEVTHAYAHDRNLALIGEEFTRGPLPDPEVAHLARSVARWTWRTFWHQGGPQAYDQHFSNRQRTRGQRPKTVTPRLQTANRTHGFQPTEKIAAARKAFSNGC